MSFPTSLAILCSTALIGLILLYVIPDKYLEVTAILTTIIIGIIGVFIIGYII